VVARSEGERQQQINVSEGQRQQAINVAEGQRQSEILRAEGQAQAIQLVAEATARAIATIGQSTVQPGGIEALQLQVARDFISQWGNLAKQSTTVLIPAEMGNIGSFIATALEIIRSREPAGSGPVVPVPPKNPSAR
jgi:regulator of protease activity HflC (stomatin/prohibitin superfamily)